MSKGWRKIMIMSCMARFTSLTIRRKERLRPRHTFLSVDCSWLSVDRIDILRGLLLEKTCICSCASNEALDMKDIIWDVFIVYKEQHDCIHKRSLLILSLLADN